MNNLILSALFVAPLAVGTGAATTDVSPDARLVPPGNEVVEVIRGDLNGDGQQDVVLVVKGTDKANLTKNRFDNDVDLNRRGMVVAMAAKDGYRVVNSLPSCFYSADEDGGVYYVPDIDVAIEGGILEVSFRHGRYGHWSYKFRYQHSEMQLIGYEEFNSNGPVVQSERSINFSTKTIITRENLNAYGEPGDEDMRERRRKFTLVHPIGLKDMVNFDDLDVEKYISVEN